MKQATAKNPAADKPAVVGRWWIITVWCLMGVLIPRASLYGELAPFGISVAAAVPTGGVATVVSLAVGYLVSPATVVPLRYVAAVALVGGMRWVLAAVPEMEKRAYLPPLTAAVATLATGILMTGTDGWRLLLVVAESVVAAGCAVVFRIAMVWLQERLRADAAAPAAGLTAGRQAALVLTGAITLMAASTVTVGGLAPGRVLAVLLTLVLARTGRESGGCTAGVILGAATAVAASGQAIPAMILACGGLTAGLFSRFGRLAETAAFLLTAGILALGGTEDDLIFRLYEVLIGCGLFLLIPRAWDRWLCRLFFRGQDLPAAQGLRRAMTMRLQMVAGAMKDVTATVETVAERLAQVGAPDTATIYRTSSQAVCGACPMHAVCWEQNAEAMLRSLEALTPHLQQDGRITPDALAGYAREHCRQPERLVAYVNASYTEYLARQAAWQRLDELQGTLRRQFGATGELLQAMAKDWEDPRQIDLDLSARVLAVCADHGIPARDAVCSRSAGNRLTVEIVCDEVGTRLDKGRFPEDLSAACGRPLAPATTAECGGLTTVTFTETARYRVETAIAQRCCTGEKLCGDTADVLALPGQTGALISDGMGSGGRAAVDSSMTVGLTARLWKAGFDPDSVLRTVNSSLLVKSREESLATLDVAVVDLFSGRLDTYKAGAAVSLLYSGGRVSRLYRSSLPIGILPDVTFEHAHDYLTAGDVLLLVSDGALTAGVAPVEGLLQEYAAKESLSDLTERIAAAVRKTQTEHADDITVVGMRLVRA